MPNKRPLPFYLREISRAQNHAAKIQRELNTARALRASTGEISRRLKRAQAGLHRQIAAVKQHYDVVILTDY